MNDIYVVFHEISPITRLNGSHYKGDENTFGPFSQLRLSLSLSLNLNLRSIARVKGLDQDVIVDDD